LTLPTSAGAGSTMSEQRWQHSLVTEPTAPC
jgi:hypothetical protein